MYLKKKDAFFRIIENHTILRRTTMHEKKMFFLRLKTTVTRIFQKKIFMHNSNEFRN